MPHALTVFRLDRDNNTVAETQVTLEGRLIPLKDIREKITHKHSSMGILRCAQIAEIDTMDETQLVKECKKINIQMTPDCSKHALVQALKSAYTTRYLKLWHDHGKIAGHGHLLVLVSCIFDEAFYYTSAEMIERGTQIDVPTKVEEPQMYLLARSGSSDAEQALYDHDRFIDLLTLKEGVTTPEGIEINDVLRFFHGDSPAAQFESGHSRGGHYICTACTMNANAFDDLQTCFRSPMLDIKRRQSFILGSVSWKTKEKPFEGLKVVELREELKARRINTEGKKRVEMEKELNGIRRGIQKFPPLLRPCPKRKLVDVGLGKYEISPCEPLHDLKGHMANLFEELPKHVSGLTAVEIKKIKSTLLGKDTLRCVDYRKACILLCKAMHETQADESHVLLIDTLVEICEIMYADVEQRSPRSILRLHNLTYLHGRLCVKLFYNPKAISKRKMFGKYFHSITTHAAILNRLVSLRSLNAELQERAFGQANAICRATSNYHSEHIISNVVVRYQVEANRQKQSLLNTQNSAVSDLGQALPTFTNTVLPKNYVVQAHLERVSDFLLQGYGVW